ncbi:Leucine-rich repeat and coiled-coil domain-containing protein 1 [Durusdinium trenchii]|uniref:Leucine-rich repeat and coiled-coil domain-containing protein 1 n=1 Tax=Durusdinium trenchii TaxID=1381693 RepID=A0ABP0PY72_9DINO
MSLDLLAAGLTSLHEIAGDGNEHAEPSTEKELILSGNCIKQVRPSDFKGVRRCLRVLDLSCNELKGLEGLQGLCALQELRLAYNHIECLEGQMNFWGQRSALKSLDLRCNRIAKLAQLLFLGGSTKLEEVAFQERSMGDGGNPICEEVMYRRQCVLQVLPWLKVLDGASLVEDRDASTLRPRVGEASLLRDQLEQATAELQLARKQAELAKEEAEKAQRNGLEAAQEREATLRKAEADREARLRADLEEIVVVVQKHEDHFSQQLAKLSAADQELPAAEAVQKEEARALTEEESCWEELLRSEKNELSLAARWKSEKLDAEEMLAEWHSCRKHPGITCPDVQAIRLDLERTQRQLQETRSNLKIYDEEKLQSLSAEVQRQENILAETRMELCEQEDLARCWNLETAAAAGRLAAIRGTSAAQARAGVEEVAAQTCLAEGYEESLSRYRAEEAQLQKAELNLRPHAAAQEQGDIGDMEHLLRSRDRLRLEIKELEGAQSTRGGAVSILEEKLQLGLEQALQALQQSHARLSMLETDVEQKGKAHKLAQKQEELDRLMLSEMKTQLTQCRDAERNIFLQVSQRLGDTTSIEVQVHDAMENFQFAQKKIQELEKLRSSYVQQRDFAACVEAVQATKEELRKLGEEKLQKTSQLGGLQAALETRREELSNMLQKLQDCQAEGESTQTKLKIKTHMIGDAALQMGELRQSLSEAGRLKQENDLAWRDRLAEATARVDEYMEQADALHGLNEEQQEEAAKLCRIVEAKGERNHFVELQLDQVQRLAADKKSSLEAKAQAMQQESAQIMNEARWASSEMEERFRLQRAEQLEEERRARSRLLVLQQQLRAAPQNLEKLRQHLTQERMTSKERVRRLLANFETPALTSG